MTIKDIIEKLEVEKENANNIRMQAKEFWYRKFQQGKMQLAKDLIDWIKSNLEKERQNDKR